MSEEQLIATPGVFGENGNFLLERELGRGGMGGVYMGRDKMLDRPVAVKVMLKEYGSDAEFVEKFKREAQAVARLIHPNIAQVYSYGFSDGMPYIAMELVAGGSLDGLMKHQGKDIEVPRVMKICEQVAQALRCAADQGLVHGDVKPENILLDANGNAKLVDFGLAAMQKDTDEIWGTPYYIAPEKCRRQPVDYRADMYSLGGTLYHALTGVPPFEGDDATEVVKKRFMGPPKKPSEVRPGLSPQIDNLVMTMLAVEPKDRYPSFEALLEEFKKVMTTGLSMTTTISPAAAASAGAAAGAGTPRKTTMTKGGKKIMMKPKKGFKVKPPSAGDEPPPPDGSDAEADGSEGSPGAEGAKKKYDDDEDEEGGGLGLKVIGVIVGVIALIGAVVGGLVWYQVSAKNAEEAEIRQQIQGGIAKARESLKGTREATVKFAANIEEFAANTTAGCEESTKRLRGVLAARYSEAVLAMLKPAESDELVQARAAFNAPDPVEQPAAPAEASAATGAAAPTVAIDASQLPPGMDAATASNMVAAVAGAMTQMAEAMAGAMTQAVAQVATEMAQSPAAAPLPTPAPAPAAAAEEVPSVVKDINGLWAKTYHVQAVAFKMRRESRLLLKRIDAALDVKGDDEATMTRLVDTANELKDKYEELRGSSDVTSAEKDAGIVRNRCKRMLETEIKRAEMAAKQEQRDKAKRDELLARLRRELGTAKEQLALVEEEVAQTKQKFAEVAASGRIKQFDWGSVERMLKSLEPQLKTPEGRQQLGKEQRKVAAMRRAQDAMAKQLKGFTFAKSKLKGSVVQSANDREIVVAKPDGRKAPPIGWARFYRDFHGNLNELINKFVRGGRNPGLKMQLNHNEWFDAMIGTAYLLNDICSDDATTAAFVEQLVREAVVKDIKVKRDVATSSEDAPAPAPINESDEEIKALRKEIQETQTKKAEIERTIRKTPYYRDMFPDIDFDKIAEAAAAEE